MPHSPIPWLKRFLRAILTFQETPHRIGLALGLGLALGVLPGTGATAAAAVAAVFRLNLPLMVLGALAVNPLTTPLVYAASYFVGHFLLGTLLPIQRISRFVTATVVGGIVLAVAAGMAGYLVARFGVSFFRARRVRRRAVRTGCR